MAAVLPLRIRVGADVITVDASDGAARDLTVEGRDGDSCQSLGRIRLDETVAHRRTVLLHEVIHQVWASTGLPAIEAVEPHEEVIIRALSPLLLDTLQRNPGLVDYLLDGDD